MSASDGWNTIESDAGVFTYLLETLGASNVECEDLLSLDPDELRTLRPLYGVIFLFKYPTDKPYTSASGPQDGAFDHSAAEDGGGLFFAQQTIQNACGTQALLSVVLNRCAEAGDADAATGTGEQPVELGPVLAPFRSFAMDLPVALRGEVLSNSPEIRTAHNALARSAPFVDETRRVAENPDEAEDAFHFIAYLPWRGRLWELDGLQPAPISHGPLKDDATGTGESFEDKVVEVLRRRIARYAEAEIRFHLIAVARDRRAVARELGDEDMLEREQGKRLRWMWDNELRAHNHLAFSAEVLKAVAAAKLDPARGGGDEAWKGYLDEGMAAAKKRAKEQRRALRLLKGDAAAAGGAGKADEDEDDDVEMMTG